MAARTAQVTEAGGLGAIITIWISASMDWLNENHYAIYSIVAIITGIVTIVAAVCRIRLKRRELEIYQQDVNNHKKQNK